MGSLGKAKTREVKCYFQILSVLVRHMPQRLLDKVEK